VLQEMYGARYQRSVNATRLLPYYQQDQTLADVLKNDESDEQEPETSDKEEWISQEDIDM
jgi:hypothetical protein